MTGSEERRILVLDDDPTVTRAIEALIQLETPWRADTFNRPDEALASLNGARYDAVISDFLMPEMDGIKFLARVREIQPASSRIMLTGYADKQNAIRSINEVGLYQYIEKPWDNEDLLLVLRNAVERSSLLAELDDKMRSLSERDRNLEAIRARLLKAIL
jgi:DNA-binding NtrC family response regulator